MTILNTTFVIHHDIASSLLPWIKDDFASSALPYATGKPMLAKVLGNYDPEADSYALHIPFADEPTAEAWTEHKAHDLLQKMSAKWGDKALFFQTLLEVIE